MPTITSETWDAVSAPALPSGWTVDSPLATSTAYAPTSAPNALIYPVASNPGTFHEYFATWGTADGTGGNVKVSSVLRFAGTTGAGQQNLGVFARANQVAATATTGTLSCYKAVVQRNGPTSNGLNLLKVVAGTATNLANVGSAAFADATDYKVALLCNGTQIQVTCQRLSDNFWLTSSGAFVADPTNTTVAISVVDSAVPAASGYAGLSFYADNTGGSPLCSDDWLLETATGYGVGVSPATAVLAPGAAQQFSATVTGTANQAVTWSVQEVGGGAVSTAGLYTAPVSPGTYHVLATAAVDGTTVGQAVVTVSVPTAPSAPAVTISTASGQDTIALSAASTPGTNAVAGYRLYEGASPGAETDTGLTISPASFPASFPAQTTASAGTGKYYVVRAYDTAAPTPTLSAPSNEVSSRTTGLVPSGTLAQRVFVAPYGATASGLAASLGYTVYDYQGALLSAHTTGHTYEVAPGSGIYAALVGIDTNYAGVLVWDAPSGSGPYVEAFDAGAFAQVAGYAGGLDPASMILQSPAHKLLTNAAGQVDVDWSEAIPATASGLTLGRAALAAIAEGVGVWKYDPAARTLVEYAEDGTTVLRSFALTIDGAGTITQRA